MGDGLVPVPSLMIMSLPAGYDMSVALPVSYAGTVLTHPWELEG